VFNIEERQHFNKWCRMRIRNDQTAPNPLFDAWSTNSSNTGHAAKSYASALATTLDAAPKDATPTVTPTVRTVEADAILAHAKAIVISRGTDLYQKLKMINDKSKKVMDPVLPLVSFSRTKQETFGWVNDPRLNFFVVRASETYSSRGRPSWTKGLLRNLFAAAPY